MGDKIPQEFIDDLLSRVDIVNVIDARVPLKKAGKEYKGLCPFHSEKTPSFTVSSQKQFYHCFGCGAHGNAISFLMEHDRVGFRDAVEELAGLAGMRVPTAATVDPNKQRSLADLYAQLDAVARYYRHQLKHHPERQKAVDYLKSRGLSGEIAAEYEIGYAPPGWNGLIDTFGDRSATIKALADSGMLISKEDGVREDQRWYDRFRDRVMFPIRDKRGRVVGFGGRVVGEGTPKYLNSPETEIFHKGHELYGLYQARKAQREFPRIVVVEGYMDVVGLAQYGIRYSVATLGTALTETNLNELARQSREIVFCFDGDRAGRQAAWRALETSLPAIHDGLELRFMFLPDGEDPDTAVRRFGREYFEQKVAEARPLSEFFFDTLIAQADMRGLDGQARLVDMARPLLGKLPRGAFRDLMLARLGQVVGLAAGQLRGTMSMPAEAAPQSAPRAVARRVGAHGVSSPVKVALALLLEWPEIAQHAGEPNRFEELSIPGIRLLQSMLEFLRDRPNFSTGAILEHWRGTPEGESLARLASWDHPVPRDGALEEFLGTLRLLDDLLLEQRTESLLQKSKVVPLSPEEKQALQALLLSGQAKPRELAS